MKHKYGEYTEFQIREFKTRIRRTIFLLLLSADPKTKNDYAYVNPHQVFRSLLFELGGASSVFPTSPEIVEAVNLLEQARKMLKWKRFNFEDYRKLILDAGASIGRMKEVDNDVEF